MSSAASAEADADRAAALPPIPLNDLRRHAAATAGPVEQAVRRVLERGRYLLGPEGEAFEAAFAGFCGVGHAVGVASGTDAIELALRAIGIARGDAVATVANAGFYASAALLAIGARPVFADIDPATHLMTAETLGHALEGQPARAVIVTHLYGRLADLGAIAALCAARGLPLIEDCAQAHGAIRDGRRAGSVGWAGCFSFYPTKNLGAAGDAGAVVTGRLDIAERLRALRQYGWETKYRIAEPGGRNSRLDEIQAAVLRAKLPLLERWNRRRREIARQYSAGIVHPRVVLPTGFGEDHAAHLYVVACDDRESLRRHLAGQAIATDVHYPVPDHRQAPLAHLACGAALPVTETMARRVLTLPCFPEMTDEEAGRVVEAVNGW
jgi:dTDP-4-amino-4,6-dideoxygalactose transaminase